MPTFSFWPTEQLRFKVVVQSLLTVAGFVVSDDEAKEKGRLKRLFQTAFDRFKKRVRGLYHNTLPEK